MLKKFFLALALSAGLLSPAYSAGTITLSLTPQVDRLGKPLAGGKLYLFAAGTTTPQSAYQDANLTIALPNPITLDSTGRIPFLFLADGNIKIRLTDKSGVVQLAADSIPVIGASSGGTPAPSVDPTTVLATGDFKSRQGTGVLSGFVRANGRTIGSATSGATERANADCQALFEYLWTNDPSQTVSTGKGVSANADWVANKTITLPDSRGRALAGLADMGNTASTIWSSAVFTSGNATTLGAKAGASVQSILQTNLPNVTLTTAVTDPGHPHALTPITRAQFALSSGSVGPFLYGASLGGGAGINADTHATGITASTALGGSGTTLQTASPFLFVTTYMKL